MLVVIQEPTKILPSTVITAYPVPQIMEEISECNYTFFNISKYQRKIYKDTNS